MNKQEKQHINDTLIKIQWIYNYISHQDALQIIHLIVQMKGLIDCMLFNIQSRDFSLNMETSTCTWKVARIIQFIDINIKTIINSTCELHFAPQWPSFENSYINLSYKVLPLRYIYQSHIKWVCIITSADYWKEWLLLSLSRTKF